MSNQAQQNMKPAVGGVKDVRTPTFYNRLVIGCHSGLKKYEDIDIKNGKILIAKNCPEVSKEAINEETTMPSVSDLKRILNHKDSRAFLVFVGHSDEDGHMILKNMDDGTEQEPNKTSQGLMDCKGTLALCLYTCYSHKWADAIRGLANGGCRDILSSLTIKLRICTQPYRDVLNDKSFSYRMNGNYTGIVGEQSEGKDGKGHTCLHDDIQDGAVVPWTRF